MVDGIASALAAIFILFAVGALIGTWAMSGALLAMVPNLLLVLRLRRLRAGGSLHRQLADGSRHDRLGLMGVAAEMDLSPAVTAGAVISGAYFGDKMSPLSDTVNLAAAAAGAQLFDHIRASLVTAGAGTPARLAGFLAARQPG